MNNTTKTGIDSAETTSKRVVQNTAETTGDLIRNEIADKVKQKVKKKKMKYKKFTYHQKKDSKLLMS